MPARKKTGKYGVEVVGLLKQCLRKMNIGISAHACGMRDMHARAHLLLQNIQSTYYTHVLFSANMLTRSDHNQAEHTLPDTAAAGPMLAIGSAAVLDSWH